MIIVPVKEGENIERAIKKFKRKFDKTGGACEVCAIIARSRRYVILCLVEVQPCWAKKVWHCCKANVSYFLV